MPMIDSTLPEYNPYRPVALFVYPLIKFTTVKLSKSLESGITEVVKVTGISPGHRQ